MAVGEVINGNIRVRYSTKKFGRRRAKTISFYSGTLILFFLCWIFLGWISPSDQFDCFIIGGIWASMLLVLDLYFGRYVFKLGWDKILDDLNPLKGNLLTIGLIFILFCPYVVFQMQR